MCIYVRHIYIQHLYIFIYLEGFWFYPHIHIYIYIYIYIYTCMNIRIYIYIYAYIHMKIYIHMYTVYTHTNVIFAIYFYMAPICLLYCCYILNPIFTGGLDGWPCRFERLTIMGCHVCPLLFTGLLTPTCYTEAKTVLRAKDIARAHYVDAIQPSAN